MILRNYPVSLFHHSWELSTHFVNSYCSSQSISFVQLIDTLDITDNILICQRFFNIIFQFFRESDLLMIIISLIRFTKNNFLEAVWGLYWRASRIPIRAIATMTLLVFNLRSQLNQSRRQLVNQLKLRSTTQRCGVTWPFIRNETGKKLF